MSRMDCGKHLYTNARQAGDTSEEVLCESKDLTGQSDVLGREVKGFIDKIRAG